MTLGRRYELLMANAAHNIPECRRRELIEIALQWMESDACSVETVEEMFYLWGAMTGIQMKAYEQTIQTQIGGEILKKEFSK